MRNLQEFTLIATIALATLAITDTASAGEPFHPFWEPTFRYFLGYFWF